MRDRSGFYWSLKLSMQPVGQRHDPKHSDLAWPEHGTARSQPCPCQPETYSGPCLGWPLGPPSGPLLTADTVSARSENLWNLKYQVLWLVKLVTFGMWNMICEYIVLYELRSINVCDLNVIYLCFIEFFIKFGVFHIAGHGPARRTIEASGRHDGLWRHGPMARVLYGPVPYRAVPSTGPLLNFIDHYVIILVSNL